IDMKQQRPETISSIKIPPGSVSLDKKVALVRQGNKTARSLDSRIRQASIIYRDSLQKVKIATSGGITTEDERIYTTGVAHIIAADGASIHTGLESAGGLAGYELFETNPMAT